MATSYDISIEQGSTLNLKFNALDSFGNYLNLSGYQARGKMKYNYGSSGYLLDLSPQIDTGYSSGLINVSVSASITSGLPVTKGVYDIEVYNSGSTIRVSKGYAEVSPEVTFS